MLQQPENRTPLPHIISHPFLVSPTAVTPLRQTKAQSPSPVKRNLASKERFQGEENHPLTKKTLSYHRPPRHSSVNFTQTPSVSRTRVVLRDIANTELRALLESEITTNITTQKPCLMAPTRRVVSDPAPRSTGLVSSIPIGVHLGNRYIDSSASSPLPVADDNLAADSSPGPSVADSEHRRAPPLTMVSNLGCSRWYQVTNYVVYIGYLKGSPGSSGWHNTASSVQYCATERSNTQDNVWPSYHSTIPFCARRLPRKPA